MKRLKMFCVLLGMIMLLTACADGISAEAPEKEINESKTENSVHKEINEDENNQEKIKENMAEEIDYTVPEEFVDYVKFVGKDISVLNTNTDEWESNAYSHDLWEGKFYGHKGKVSVRVGWDAKTILEFFLVLDDDAKISENERSELNEKLTEIFGKMEEKNISYEFSGNGDYTFSLPKTLEQESVCIVGWNSDNLHNFQLSQPKLEEEPSQEEPVVIKKEPSIGMTEEEVRESSWGSPNDINKTTTKYGVREQWVYSNGKYIYFEDGVVTAIQE